jgi:hypothetical protein
LLQWLLQPCYKVVFSIWDAAIEEAMKQCQTCQESHPQLPFTHAETWSCLHLDFAGPHLGSISSSQMHTPSGWTFIPCNLSNLRNFWRIMAFHTTLSQTMALPSFTIQQFIKDNGIAHIKSAPYYPSTNGLAERAVQIFKQG